MCAVLASEGSQWIHCLEVNNIIQSLLTGGEQQLFGKGTFKRLQFNLCRYEIRRDDPTPPPWSEEGKKRMEDMGSEINLSF